MMGQEKTKAQLEDALGGVRRRLTQIGDGDSEDSKDMTFPRSGDDLLEALLHASPAAIVVLDREGRVVLWNPAAESIFGWTEPDVLGALNPIVPESERQLYETLWDRVAKGEAINNIALRRQRKDGSWVDVLLSATPLRHSSGESWGLLGVFVDISQLRQADEALRQERDLLGRIMQTSPSAITVVNEEGQIVFANSRAEEIFALTRDEILSRTYNAPSWNIVDYEGDPLEDAALPFQRILTDKRPLCDLRHAILWPDGRKILLSINGAPLTDVSGQINGAVFVIDDVTERIEDERRRIEELEKELHALEILVSAGSSTSVTAQMFGVKSLREGFPAVFDDLVGRYDLLLDRALENRVYKVQYPISDDLRAMAQTLGSTHAGPRDVIALHTYVLKEKSEAYGSVKMGAYAEEGRLIALELMGYLVSYYRSRFEEGARVMAVESGEGGKNHEHVPS